MCLDSFICTCEGDEWSPDKPPKADDRILLEALKDTIKIAYKVSTFLELEFGQIAFEAIEELKSEPREEDLSDELPAPRT